MHTILNFDGKFSCWSYTVSHAQLLLRRTKSTRFPTRVDVLFKNVAMIQLPTLFDGLIVEEGTVDSVPEVKAQLGSADVSDCLLYIIRGNNYTGYVVAGSVTWLEDDGEYYDPSSLVQTN